jgi:trypsin-like peptidase
MRLHPRGLRRAVLPVCNRLEVIGTATAIAPGLALTALHVVAQQDPGSLSLGGCCPVAAVESLPLAEYGAASGTAARSQRRVQRLVDTEVEEALGTVDLALLIAPTLHAPAIRPRESPVAVGEHVLLPGYPGGYWSLNQGVVTEADDGEFAVNALLGPAVGGAPALDFDNRLVGVVGLGHRAATMCVGPALLTAFLDGLLAATG